MTLSVQGVGGLTGPVHGATLTHERLALGPNGYAFLTATDRVNVIA